MNPEPERTWRDLDDRERELSFEHPLTGEAPTIDVSARVAALHAEKNLLVARLTDIHREIDAYGYLHPQNHPLRRYRNPGPYLPDEPPELDRSRNGVPDRTLELMFQPIDKIGRPGSGGQTGTPGADG